jgi:ribosomal protein S27E
MKEHEYENIKAIVHSDFLDKPAVNTIYYGQPQEYVKCPNCGAEAILDSEVLTSMPPQRRIRCPHCGLVATDFEHQLDIYFKSKDQDEKPKEEYRYATKCIICGEETKFNGTLQHPFICGKCKKASKRLRKMLDEE